MKELIKHLLENNKEEILSKSLMNCHAIGLHSIMLLESPGKTIRLYVTTPDHELWKNMPFAFMDKEMTIGFHPHHCNLTLHCIHGQFYNWVVEEKGSIGLRVNKYLYQSEINQGEFALTPVWKSTVYCNDDKSTWILKNQSVAMMANEIHTVGVAPLQLAAWFVYEGEEDPNYKSFLWSNNDMPNVKDDRLYKKMDEYDLVHLLESVGLF